MSNDEQCLNCQWAVKLSPSTVFCIHGKCIKEELERKRHGVKGANVMNLADEHISTIHAAGLEVDAETLLAIQDAIDKVADALKRIADAAAEVVNRIWDFCKRIWELPPRKRYEMVKKLGSDIYPMFFRREPVYHCRNNC